MRDLIAIVGVYQDRDAGEGLLRNLESYDIPSIWSDGRVLGFPRINNSDQSTDGMRELVQSSKNAILVSHEPNYPGCATTECYKIAGDMGYRYAILLGCDEYVQGDPNLLHSNLERLNLKKPERIRIPFVEHNPQKNFNNGPKEMVIDRIIYMPQYVYIKKDIHWFYYHNYFGYEYPMTDYSKLVYGITIHHDDSIRPKWRDQLMDDYQKERTTQEHERLRSMLSERVEKEFEDRFLTDEEKNQLRVSRKISSFFGHG